jgi:hypothetical protein
VKSISNAYFGVKRMAKESYKEFMAKVLTPTMKSKRELLADFYMTAVGVLVSILAIQKGGLLMVFGIAVLIMILLLLFIPEN